MENVPETKHRNDDGESGGAFEMDNPLRNPGENIDVKAGEDDTTEPASEQAKKVTNEPKNRQTVATDAKANGDVDSIIFNDRCRGCSCVGSIVVSYTAVFTSHPHALL